MNSKTLFVNDFDLLIVDHSFGNAREIMSFCGLSEVDTEESLRFFEGGDAFLFEDVFGETRELGNDVHPGDYLLKFRSDKKIVVLRKDIFEMIFRRNH